VEAALRQSFRTQPEALAIIEQEFDGSGCAVAEDKDRATERLFREHLTADGGEAINPLPEIHWGCGHQDPTLWGELDHQSVSKNVRTNAATGGVASW
jgi:hypothetical protein